MGLSILNPAEYGRLCADIVPKIIENDEEFDRAVDQMEALDFRPNPTPEEHALSALLELLIRNYDNQHYPLPELPPDRMIRYLMEQRDLRQADLLSVFGSRSVASDVITGKRAPSKTHLRGLAQYFHVSPEVFL
jgi:HTH-type transcriptional regulator/antitoxin HigA